MAVAVGQITIMDFNDAITLTGWITSNHTKSIRYDGNNEIYYPDFGTNNLILTPSLFKAGGAGDLMVSGTNIKSVTWKRKSNTQSVETSLSSGETVSSSFPKTLTITSQPFSETVFSVEYICTIIYTDPTTGLDLVYKSSLTFNKVTDGNNIAVAEITANPSFAFKNKLPSTTTLSAHLYRGVTKDTTNLTYVWQKLIGEIWTNISGQTTINLTVHQNEVDSMQPFRVKITDSIKGDEYTSAPVSVLDFNDPIKVEPYSTMGNTFQNGIIATDIIGKLYQNGEEVDVDGNLYSYSWTKTDKDGVVTNYGTGKTISVGSSDINAKAVFACTVS
ncbi:MAG: hypothetical protein PQJ49_10530 [Sphaerochaetaceae bacterium]|nr:hypothetical protein [Sphaerochaetaceae bacterium]